MRGIKPGFSGTAACASSLNYWTLSPAQEGVLLNGRKHEENWFWEEKLGFFKWQKKAWGDKVQKHLEN